MLEQPNKPMNYYVTIVKMTRHFGGYEEGGWYYTTHKVVSKRQLKFPNRDLSGRARTLIEAMFNVGQHKADCRHQTWLEVKTGWGKPVEDQLHHPHYE